MCVYCLLCLKPCFALFVFLPCASWYYQSFIYSPTDALVSCLTYLFTYSIVQSPSWATNWFAASQEISPHFTEPEGSLLHSQASCHLSLSWASPIQSIYPHRTSWRSILILSTHLRLDLPSGLLPSGFPSKILYTPSPYPYAPHAQPIFPQNTEFNTSTKWKKKSWKTLCGGRVRLSVRDLVSTAGIIH